MTIEGGLTPSFSIALPQPTNDSLVVNRWADYLVVRLFKPEYEYKKAGSGLVRFGLKGCIKLIGWSLLKQQSTD